MAGRQNVLVTGGAGYIGSHVCLALQAAGFNPISFDNLSSGHPDFVRWGPFEHGDIRDRDRVGAVIQQYAPVAVLHLAALVDMRESTHALGRFFDTNVIGALRLVQGALEGGIKAIVFSSSCAVYGEAESPLIDEAHAQAPLTPYGRSKLIVEQVLSDYDQHAGVRSVSLRYFNAAGADDQGRIGERHEPETHAIPLAIRSTLDRGEPFRIFGCDYPTPDGTAVRDYVHVQDLADAHVDALRYLLQGGQTRALNLGAGKGVSVRELLVAVGSAVGRPPRFIEAERRPGDAAIMVADNREAGRVLGWTPNRSFADIVHSAVRWQRANLVSAPA